jgi:hypothetical protein
VIEGSSTFDMNDEISKAPAHSRAYDRLDRIVTRVESFVMIFAYAVLMAIIGFETLRRIIFSTNWLAGPDVALYAFVWLAWFAMAHNIHNDTHLSFTEFRERFPSGVRRAFEVFDCLLWLGSDRSPVDVRSENFRYGHSGGGGQPRSPHGLGLQYASDLPAPLSYFLAT